MVFLSNTFDWERDGEWYRLLINGSRSAIGVCVIEPCESKQTHSTQADLQRVLIEAVEQLLEAGIIPSVN